jgi:hypothetical protein
MLKLKMALGSWTRVPQKSGDTLIYSQNEKNVADVFSNSNSFAGGLFVDQDEADFNAKLISKAPDMARSLLEIHSQLTDRNQHEAIRKGIEVLLKNITV